MHHVAREPATPARANSLPAAPESKNSNPTHPARLMPLPLLLRPLSTAPLPRASCHGRRLTLKPPVCRRGLVRVRASSETTEPPPPSRTQAIMDKISSSAGDEVGGAGGAYSYDALKRLDQICSSICSAPQQASSSSSSNAPPQIVTRVQGAAPAAADLGAETFDVLVCGGTLGIFIATALSYRGLRVGIVERNAVKGREQEWNISRKELMEIVQVGILSAAEAEEVVTSDFNPNRCGFEGKGEIWVEDILHLGISPAKLVEIMKSRFISSGGQIFEGKSVSSISVHDDLAVLKLSDGDPLHCRLVVDAMGNFSPIVRQIRSGRRPDGLCLVVGACARGFQKNTTSDVIFSSSSVKKVGDSGRGVQLFWEAFPAGSGPTDRTTYMFTYVDPQFGCPKLEELLEMFWDLMPGYQDTVLDNLDIRRVIYGIFPTYRDSPLPAAFDRILQVGDASGIQSPVSFGGFGSLTRHLGRLSNGVYEAVSGDFLDTQSLRLLNPYMPNLSASWLFQRAMSTRPGTNISPTFTNELLFANFQSIQKLGDSVLRPFLQDVIQFGPLVKTLGLVMISRPQILPEIFRQVGVGVILNWSGHFVMLGYYTFLSSFVGPAVTPWVKSLAPRDRYQWERYLEAWEYGAGLDYRQEE